MREQTEKVIKTDLKSALPNIKTFYKGIVIKILLYIK